ncbi:DEAD/DEAH box helicase family protein [Roseofilum sp. BLCC_M91]|uniref:DEAD/DEAH box helicase family protein n=1 Tax=Roseofilum halophilum BLCC-M91 TaxID=3022259 RepID=A0ABT7BFA2_9CYAN|nr:DEAD/DEAH box helicase [Roseofilum halophilum]MDJ1177850.1 DEAD/DEAH box helicase family protein [Roseofilum halophilum BLCC-M91]
MAFKKIQYTNICPETPEALYRDLRNRKIEGLLSHQADVLRAYTEKGLNEKDLAIQLPTGSGKTLVGLLIAEWRRRKNKEKVVYVCPTKQLANQVVEQSLDKYGIKCDAFIGSQRNYSAKIKSAYNNAETLAVTTYSALFNTNSFFDNADIIVFDDVHSAENYIVKHWSVLISRRKQESKDLFENILTLLTPVLPTEDKTRMLSDSPDISDLQWVQKLATPRLYDLHSDLIQLLDQYTKDTNSDIDSNIKYPWSVIRDHLLACHFYFSYNQILIRPLIPPITSHLPFFNPIQRIYMSATMGKGGDLERLIGIEKIYRLPIPEGWDQQGIGRRLLLFPEMEFNESQAFDITIEMIKKSHRALILTPDNDQASLFKEKIQKEYKVFEVSELEKSKQNFVNTDKAVAIVANRYDGIDLIAEECRLLIIKDLQRATNLQEKFLVTRLAAGILLNERTLTRIIQALGRCTRSATDYAAVIILGEDLSKILSEKGRFLHPELQAEINFGYQQSKEVEKEDFIDNLDIFFKHGEEWNSADEEIITLRNSCHQENLPGIETLESAVTHEIRYQYALWHKDYEKAIAECESVLTSLDDDTDNVKGYRAFWNYLAGSAAWLGAKEYNSTSIESKARTFFKKASEIAPEVNWFIKLSRLQTDGQNPSGEDPSWIVVIENLETQLTKLGTRNNNKFDRELKFITSGIINQEITPETSSKEKNKLSSNFEEAHKRLGTLLGYKAGNVNSTATPDPWWIVGDFLCIVFEDFSSATPEKVLPVDKVRQAVLHPNWIKDNEKIELSISAQITPVIISPCSKIDKNALSHAEGVFHWSLKDFQEWTFSAITAVRELRSSFSGEADIEWRKQAIQKYRDNKIDPESLLASLKLNPLSRLPVD